ncbi:cation:proton antiporter [Mycolicibacterium confluentis]|uniref:Cation/H+ exchanger transmembrane domain-containing protein n=1 Tax=Mycolicibacterium confluentis TaxID=28047 RepID=A0A7I7Y5E0_9MYCO|nr:cation:proton antiporter [Mycolicibacterium confluentis]MCV7319244.1 cation:proton antiporter [Mycolicibacterium confluentis]ORV24948.1 sodium:proton antiporter [Mycolicibacterium confluentis]BBZ36859.1 hypothetical protein MCNF_54640 [Mycolicibacterium confluentis]
MGDFGFDDLALLAAIGLVGPLLAAAPGLRLPVIIGELAAGLVIGNTGLRVLDPDEPTFAMLAAVGFALVMFVVGTHVPIHEIGLRGALPAAVARSALIGVVAAGLAVLLDAVFGGGHILLFAVLMASSSAALALPLIQSLELDGPPVLSVTAQIAIADTAAIVLVPLVIETDRAVRTAVGAVVVAGAAAVIYGLLRLVDRRRLRRFHKYSERHRFALELRISLLLLFALAAIATTAHVSTMLAGFTLGLAVGAVGQPRRLARQLFGITEGFFGPVFFVWLGASLDVRELAHHPRLIALGVALGLGAVAAHAVAVFTGQPLTLAVLASGQLGVPIAAATLGTEDHLLAPGEPAALMLGALVTIAAVSIANRVARHRRRIHETPGPPEPQPSA